MGPMTLDSYDDRHRSLGYSADDDAGAPWHDAVPDLRVAEAAARRHYLPMPGRPPVPLPLLDRLPVVGARLGLHSFLRAVK